MPGVALESMKLPIPLAMMAMMTPWMINAMTPGFVRALVRKYLLHLELNI